MGGSGSKEAPIDPVPLPTTAASASDSGNTVVRNSAGGDHTIVVIEDSVQPGNVADAKARYRPASKEALAFRDATNVNADKLITPGGTSSGGGAIPSRQSKVLVKDSRDYIIEHEGLMVGDEKRRQLSQQWWFALSSEPLQRGLDAGLVGGALTAAMLVMFKKQYRTQPIKVAFLSVVGFSVACVSVPLSVIYLDAKNAEKVRQRDRDKMQAQRDEYLSKRPPGM